MMRRCIAPLTLLALVAAATSLRGSDPPHVINTGNTRTSGCNACHKLHNSPGGTLTIAAGNANLCITCHTAGGLAAAKPFASSNQVLPAKGLPAGETNAGTSHRWDSSAAGSIHFVGGAQTSTGSIRPSGTYTGAYATTIEIRISTAGAVGVARFDWRMTTLGGSAYGTTTAAVATGASVALGTTGISLVFTNGAAGTSFVLNETWHVHAQPDLRTPVTPALAARLQNGQIMCSTCHDQHSQAQAPHDPTSSQTYVAGTTNNRRFQRVANNSGEMCGDCHAARNVGKGGTSHPVHVNRAAAPNTKAPSASLVLNTAGNVECLTCHDIHGAPTNTTPAGMLLRVSNSTALCADCHTNADTTSANVHTNPASGALWPGDQYGGSTYPAFTLAADRGACKNCHTPHGWPDANNPGQKYAKALGARQDNLCSTCHDSNGPSNKDVRTQILKTYRHPVERTSGRTVGCGDCHNPHMAMAGIHTAGGVNGNRIRSADGATIYSRALRGASGVRFNYAGLANWATPPSTTGAANTWFTYIPSGAPSTPASGAEFEYQVCFKCHTSYAFGSTPPTGMVTGSLTLASGSLQPWVLQTGVTASFTSGSTAVTGSATNTWNTPANRIRYMYIRHVGYTGTLRYVSTVTSNTAITLSGTYGTTAANQPYELRASASFPAAGTTVTGNGTNWTSALVGQYIQNTSVGTAYRITAVASATSLTITPAYGATAHNYLDFYLHPAATFTNGSTTVTGVGTAWTTAMVGDTIQKSGDATTFTVASVQSATQLTLNTAYTGTTSGFPTRYLLAGKKVQTDVAQDFNPNNASGHPVVVGLNSYGAASIAPKALTAAQMKAPWATNLGTQTMTCSDCHNTDAASPAAQGPHGSTVPFMLKGPNAANWPNVVLSSGFGTSWCANCHNNSAGEVHGKSDHSSRRCYECHIVVPHGGKLARLIGDRDGAMPARYAYNGDKNTLIITGFTKTTTNNYSKSHCGTSSCTGDHPTANGDDW
jgi:predicted CXXCH cytochrome family protein